MMCTSSNFDHKKHFKFIFLLSMSPHHIIIEYLIHLRALYEDLLSPYSFILDLNKFAQT